MKSQPEPKQHHFVHRAYLEGFADPNLERNGKIYVWAYLPSKAPFRQKPERIAKRNYYYCFEHENRRQFAFEHTLQQLEDVSLPVLRKLRGRQFKLDPEERLILAGYVALSYTRVPTFENVVNRMAMLDMAFRLEKFTADPENLKLVAREESERTGREVKPDEMLKTLKAGSVYLTQTNRGWSLEQSVRIMLLLLQRIIFEMRWIFLIAEDRNDGFLTSDNPVAVFDSPTVNTNLFNVSEGISTEKIELASTRIRTLNNSAPWRATVHPRASEVVSFRDSGGGRSVVKTTIHLPSIDSFRRCRPFGARPTVASLQLDRKLSCLTVT